MPATTTSSASGKRTAILDASLGLFAERGFYGTRVPEVAQRAKVGTGTIYRYFSSKEALVNALYQHHKQLVLGAVAGRIDWDAPPREQFRALWAGIATWALKEPDAFRFLELHHHAAYLDEQSTALAGRAEELAAEMLKRGQALGAVREVDANVLIALVWGAFVGLMKASRDGSISVTPAVVAQAETACWDLISA